MNKKQWITLGVIILICQMAGFVGALATTSSVGTWYIDLIKPALNPPSWVFGPVWTLLYLLMAISAWLVYRQGIQKKQVNLAINVFALQLALNTAWSFSFFGAQNPLLGLFNILLLLISIIWTIKLFAKLSKPAAWLLVPYLLWVSFATYLNYGLWFLNR